MSSTIVRNPAVPCAIPIGQLNVGQTITVRGVAVPSRQSLRRFTLDFCCGLLVKGDHRDNKALHFNARFDLDSGVIFTSRGDRALVLNSLVNNDWGEEVRFQNPFSPGQSFELVICVWNDHFEIAVDGNPIGKYVHRLAVHSVQSLFFDGNLRLDAVEFNPPIAQVECMNETSGSSYGAPQPNSNTMMELQRPPVPFSFDFRGVGGFDAGACILLKLTPLLSGQRCAINLINVLQDEVLAHLRFDLVDYGSEKVGVVCNSRRGGEWETEQRAAGQWLSRGIAADLQLSIESGAIAVDVDGRRVIRFALRHQARASAVDLLQVEGDISILRFAYSRSSNSH